MRQRVSLVASFLMLAAATASASGFAVFEQGARATALGGAFVATADDPSAVFYNVAGIARQREGGILAGASGGRLTNEFTGSPTDSFTAGTTSEYDGRGSAPPSLFAVVPLPRNLAFGIGVFSAFDARTEWKGPWVGRSLATDTDLRTQSIQPSVAWQTADGRFALGAGLEWRRARFSFARSSEAFDPFSGRIVETSRVRVGGDWASGVTWSAGLLAELAPGWRLGVHYRAPLDVDVEGRAAFDAVAAPAVPRDQSVRTALRFPAVAAVGVATTKLPRWTFEADLTHVSWSRFRSLRFDFETAPDIVQAEEWNDAFGFHLGASRDLGPHWTLRLGALYEQSAQPEDYVSPLLPDSGRAGVSFGIGYQRGPLVVGVGQLLARHRERNTSLDADAFGGTYQASSLRTTVNVGYRF